VSACHRDPDADLLTLIRYLSLTDREWVRTGTGAVAELLQLPTRGERRAAALRDPRWLSHAKVELLLILAEEELGTPGSSLELAALGAALAARVSPSPLTSMDDQRPRALLVLARACRHCGKHRLAEQALGAAARRSHDPEDLVERALYLAELGKLRSEQGRLEEAAGLFEQTLRVLGPRRRGSYLRGAARLLGGHVYLELQQVHRGLEMLELVDLDPDCYPFLARRAQLTLELCQALAARHAGGRRGGGSRSAVKGRRAALAARRAGASGHPGGPLPPPPPRSAAAPGELLWQHWMRGRIAAASGDLEVAHRALDAVRRSLLDSGSLREAASASLDLAAARAAAGDAPGFGQLGDDLARSFPRAFAAVVAGFRALQEEALGIQELHRRTVVLRRRLAALPCGWHSRPDLVCHLARLVDLSRLAPARGDRPAELVN
jgi:tetratricopeptide (TPR) repeat protein